jgi:ankyrin repeat protein
MASRVNERLCRAASTGDVAGIAAALLAGADPNAFEGTYYYTPLQWAAAYGHVAAIAALLAAGARVDGANSAGITPLMLAAHNGHTAAVDALLAAGADLQHADKDGDTALHCASMNGHVDAARALLEAGARADVRNKEGKQPINVVRTLACSHDVAAASYCHAAALPHCHAQVCDGWSAARSNADAVRAQLACAAPWSRRRPVALACYGVEWEWEA